MTQIRAVRRLPVTPYGRAFDNEPPKPGISSNYRWIVTALVIAIVIDVGCLYALARAVGAL